MKNKNLKLAIQKNGRLTKDSVDILRAAGLQFENYNQKLFSKCKNFPLEIVFVRDDDIPDYVQSGAVDLGVVGQNVYYESNKDVLNILELNFGFCSLSVAIPKKSQIKKIEQLKNTKIFTSYPNSARKYFKEKNIPVKITAVSGSVEVAPALGMADAIVDLVASGRTLALNNLRIIEKIYDSQAILITGKKNNLSMEKQILKKDLISRFKNVMSEISLLQVEKLIL